MTFTFRYMSKSSEIFKLTVPIIAFIFPMLTMFANLNSHIPHAHETVEHILS